MGRKTTKILSGGWAGWAQPGACHSGSGGLQSQGGWSPVRVVFLWGLPPASDRWLLLAASGQSVAVPRALPSSFPSAPSFPGAVLLFRGENGDLEGGGGTRPRSPSMEPGALSPAFLCRSQSPSPRVSLSLVLPTVCAKAGVSRAPPVPCPELAPLGRNCITQLFFLYAGLVSDI